MAFREPTVWPSWLVTKGIERVKNEKRLTPGIAPSFLRGQGGESSMKRSQSGWTSWVAQGLL